MAQAEHQRVYEMLLERIRTGDLAENSRLPAERSLCEIYGVSRVTIRQALLNLERDGLILRRQGQGTFVKPSKIEQPLNSLYSFSEELIRQNIHPGTKLLSLRNVPAPENVSILFGLPKGAAVRCLCRLRLANDLPYAYENSYLPVDVLGNANEEDLCRDGLYNTIRKQSGTIVDRAQETFSAVIAPQYVVQALGRKGILSVMQLERTAYAKGRPVEYSEDYVCGDKYRFRITLNRL